MKSFSPKSPGSEHSQNAEIPANRAHNLSFANYMRNGMTKVGSIMRGRPGEDADNLNNSTTSARNKSRLFS